jgi:hypothetical protein
MKDSRAPAIKKIIIVINWILVECLCNTVLSALKEKEVHKEADRIRYARVTLV